MRSAPPDTLSFDAQRALCVSHHRPGPAEGRSRRWSRRARGGAGRAREVRSCRHYTRRQACCHQESVSTHGIAFMAPGADRYPTIREGPSDSRTSPYRRTPSRLRQRQILDDAPATIQKQRRSAPSGGQRPVGVRRGGEAAAGVVGVACRHAACPGPCCEIAVIGVSIARTPPVC